MASIGLAQDQRFQQHLTGAGHPERPQRLEAVATALEERGLTQACADIEASPIDMELVRRVHADSYIERVRKACADGLPYIDVPDSGICPRSYEISLLSAGAVINAVDGVMAGRLDHAFCAVRPPGHHAEHGQSMGFCMFNNIAIAARYLIDHHKLTRVLVLDWDVHHGNGTQHTFEDDPQVLFISLHGHPGVVYPGTGHSEERGKGPGIDLTINIPMLPPSGGSEYRRAFDDCVLPAVQRFDPQFVLISAGFDAHRLDPLAPLELETETYGWMTDELVSVAKQHCGGRLVSVLEGGYHLGALSDCVVLHVKRLLGARAPVGTEVRARP
ncbi:MAG: histone deacetylase family protein [Planctomycetota bacterium]|jgi:acetoin utilization deacetylase AcuC-like enzyme